MKKKKKTQIYYLNLPLNKFVIPYSFVCVGNLPFNPPPEAKISSFCPLFPCWFNDLLKKYYSFFFFFSSAKPNKVLHRNVNTFVI